jgi:hypothetical protein
MMLKSFGCSFIWGSDLPDLGRTGGCAPYSRLTWPATLSRQLKIRYDCHAFPGAGNLRILEQVLNQAESSLQDFFVIGWTWIDRFDYQEQDRWQTLLPVDESATAEFYYRKLHSEYVDKLSTLVHIRTAIDVLNQKRIPFLMTFMDPLVLDQTWHTSGAIMSLQQYIQPYLHLFDNKTFLEWSRAHNYPISTGWHPLDSAHTAAADIILPVAKKILNQH